MILVFEGTDQQILLMNLSGVYYLIYFSILYPFTSLLVRKKMLSVCLQHNLIQYFIANDGGCNFS